MRQGKYKVSLRKYGKFQRFMALAKNQRRQHGALCGKYNNKRSTHDYFESYILNL